MTKLATHIWYLVRQTAAGARRDNVLRLSASLAYYAIFSLGPMLLVVVFVCGYFWSSQAVESGLFVQIQQLTGPEVARQLHKIMQYAVLDGAHPLRAGIGLLMLLVAATSVFTEIQDSINSIWHLKIRPDAGWLPLLKTRLVSFILVITLGLLLLASLGISVLAARLLAHLHAYLPHLSGVLIHATDLVLSIVFTTGLYAIVYKVLPDAHLPWRGVAVGAGFTAVLFIIGRFCITFYIHYSSLNQAYGTAGTLVVLLLWVYYSALILYVGAEFTKCYAVTYGYEIRAADHAQVVQLVQVTSQHNSVLLTERRRELTERELQKAQDALEKQSAAGTRSLPQAATHD